MVKIFSKLSKLLIIINDILTQQEHPQVWSNLDPIRPSWKVKKVHKYQLPKMKNDMLHFTLVLH